MLHPVSLESLGAAVVHMHRESHGHRALGVHQPVAIVFVDVQVIGDDLELVAGHCEDFVVVNHKSRAGTIERAGGWCSWFFRLDPQEVKCKSR